MDPEWLHRTMCFVGAGDFVLGTRFAPNVFIPKMLENFRGIQKRTTPLLAFVGAPLHGDNGGALDAARVVVVAAVVVAAAPAPMPPPVLVHPASSSSAPSGTSDYVPSKSMSDGPAAFRVTMSQAPRPKKRARPKSTGKSARHEWEDDSNA